METKSWSLLLLTAVAPAAWGTTYYVTEHLLPPDRPLFAAAVRALPAGLMLLALRRRLPRSSWWWRAPLLGLLTIALFFPLIFVAGYALPGGLAATVSATSPLVVMGMARLALGERAGVTRLVAAVVGLAGVALLVLRDPGGVQVVGLAAAVGAVVVTAAGFVLGKRWFADEEEPVDMIALVSWQLVAGGLMLVPVSLVVEGGPPSMDTPAVAGFAWLVLVGTALAYVCWFHGLARMTAGSVALVGLVNPVVGTIVGVALAGEVFGPMQAVGMALVLGGVLAGQPVIAEGVAHPLRRWAGSASNASGRPIPPPRVGHANHERQSSRDQSAGAGDAAAKASDTDPARVRQMRLVVAVADYDRAVQFYRDVLGGEQELQVHSPRGERVTILDVGRATLEISNAAQIDLIDRLEVGRPVSPHVRLAFEVDDGEAVTAALVDAGADLLAPPVLTPWDSLNSRLDAPGELQLTVFEELETAPPRMRAGGPGTG